KICGRTFFPVALKKHGPICQKTATKKRKTFDSSRQRAEGTDIPTVKPLKPRPEPPKKPSNWRRKHEEFIATIRAAKGLDQALKEGGKLPPPPPPSYDPDYIQCPYCQRRFNENAADRHINFCKEQAARISNKGKFSTDTKGKATSRAQYKPPALKKSNSPGTAPSGSSRLPQPSGASKTVVGVPSGKVSSVSSSLGNKLQTLSPSHKGIAAPHNEGLCVYFIDTDKVDGGNTAHIIFRYGLSLFSNVGNIHRVIYQVRATVFCFLIWTTQKVQNLKGV
uniref:Zinc finger C2HC domain-containing protein 1A n=1 Tax=Ursus americanus TaxID=9643 RepID=A0A452QKL0_URSAM